MRATGLQDSRLAAENVRTKAIFNDETISTVDADPTVWTRIHHVVTGPRPRTALPNSGSITERAATTSAPTTRAHAGNVGHAQAACAYVGATLQGLETSDGAAVKGATANCHLAAAVGQRHVQLGPLDITR